MESEHTLFERSTPFWYKEIILKSFDISKEDLTGTYAQSRVTKWPDTSIIQKYKTPVSNLYK